MPSWRRKQAINEKHIFCIFSPSFFSAFFPFLSFQSLDHNTLQELEEQMTTSNQREPPATLLLNRQVLGRISSPSIIIYLNWGLCLNFRKRREEDNNFTVFILWKFNLGFMESRDIIEKIRVFSELNLRFFSWFFWREKNYVRKKENFLELNR